MFEFCIVYSVNNDINSQRLRIAKRIIIMKNSVKETAKPPAENDLTYNLMTEWPDMSSTWKVSEYLQN